MPIGKKWALTMGRAAGTKAAIEMMESRRLLSASPMEFDRPDVFAAPPSASAVSLSIEHFDALTVLAPQAQRFARADAWRDPGDPGFVQTFGPDHLARASMYGDQPDGALGRGFQPAGEDVSFEATGTHTGAYTDGNDVGLANLPGADTGNSANLPSWPQRLAMSREAQAFAQFLGGGGAMLGAQPSIEFQSRDGVYTLQVNLMPGFGTMPQGAANLGSNLGSTNGAGWPVADPAGGAGADSSAVVAPPPAMPLSPHLVLHKSTMTAADRSSPTHASMDEAVPSSSSLAPPTAQADAIDRAATTLGNAAIDQPSGASSRGEGASKSDSVASAAMSGLMNPAILREAGTLAASSAADLLNHVVGGTPTTTGVGTATTSNVSPPVMVTAAGQVSLAHVPTVIVQQTAAVARAMLHVSPIDAVAAFSDALAAFANDSTALEMQPANGIDAADQARSHRAWAITASVLVVDAILLARWQAHRSRKDNKGSATTPNDALTGAAPRRPARSPFCEGRPMIADLPLVE
jgi:hypothetical protein